MAAEAKVVAVLLLELVQMVEMAEMVETVENGTTNQKPTTVAADMKMRTGTAFEADKLYVVDTQTKEVRGNSMVYCDNDGNWKFVVGDRAVPNNYIRPNDMVVLISGERKTGDKNTWTWTYTPDQFYDLPNRHMGRKP